MYIAYLFSVRINLSCITLLSNIHPALIEKESLFVQDLISILAKYS